MNQAELIAALAAASATAEQQAALVTKISGETSALLAAVDALQAAVDAAGPNAPLDPAVEVALADLNTKSAAVTAALAGVDLQVPDTAPVA